MRLLGTAVTTSTWRSSIARWSMRRSLQTRCTATTRAPPKAPSDRPRAGILHTRRELQRCVHVQHFQQWLCGRPLPREPSGWRDPRQQGSGTGTFSGSIQNNVIGDPAVVGSGSSQAFGIIVGARGAGGSHTTLINGNLSPEPGRTIRPTVELVAVTRCGGGRTRGRASGALLDCTALFLQSCPFFLTSVSVSHA
jgi:hypothetical protein